MKKVYLWERNTWPEFEKIKLSRKEAAKYLKKLNRHFKTDWVEIDFSASNRLGGIYYGGLNLIRVPKETNLSTVVHEFAHHLTRFKWGPRMHHNKKFKTQLKRVYRYAKRWL